MKCGVVENFPALRRYSLSGHGICNHENLLRLKRTWSKDRHIAIAKNSEFRKGWMLASVRLNSAKHLPEFSGVKSTGGDRLTITGIEGTCLMKFTSDIYRAYLGN